MQSIELFHQNLPIEADLLDFTARLLDAVDALGGNRFAAAAPLLKLVEALRHAGAGSGYPLPVRLLVNGNTLVVRWGESDTFFPLLDLYQIPAPARIARLAEKLRRETETTDPIRLHLRNREMTRHLEETRQRTEQELRLLQQNLQERQTELRETLRQAETDPLTGLLNRRAFDDRIEYAFRRTQRQRGEVLSLMMLDLDFFKAINDLHGHQYGDEYLRRMGDTLRAVIRTDVDYAFRFGGDEFIVLMFADAVTACRKAMEILSRMDGKISIGISSTAAEGHVDGDQRDFIRVADEALYQAKRAGRGRVVVNICNHKKEGCMLHCDESGFSGAVIRQNAEAAGVGDG